MQVKSDGETTRSMKRNQDRIICYEQSKGNYMFENVHHIEMKKRINTKFYYRLRKTTPETYKMFAQT